MNLFGRLYRCPATDAAAADATVKGASDVAAGAATAGDVAATSLGGAAALDAGTALAGETALAGGAEALAGAGAVDALSGGATATLPEVTITGTAPAAAGAGTAGIGDTLLPAAAGAAGAATAGGGPAGPSTPSPQDLREAQFLPATGASDVAPLTPDLAGQFGVDTGSGVFPAVDPGMAPASFTDPSLQDITLGSDVTDPALGAAPGAGDSGGLMDWLKNPKNLATAGMLGMSMGNAIFKPQLPGAARTALDAAGPAAKQAFTTISTGGQGSPLWPGMKASIDASINKQISDAKASIMQAAANAGMQGPGVPTGVTSEQIATMTSNFEVQRQQMYEQALNQIVNQAVQELSGADSVLMAIANEQLALDQEARQSAGQTAQLAMLLQSLGG